LSGETLNPYLLKDRFFLIDRQKVAVKMYTVMKNPPLKQLTFAILCALSVGLAPVSQADDKISELKTATGKTYQHVQITKVTPSEISFIHESGAARIALKDLPDELKTKYGYNPVKAEAYATVQAKAEALAGKQLAEAAKQQEEAEALADKQLAEVANQQEEAEALIATAKPGVFIVDQMTDIGLLVNNCSRDHGNYERFNQFYVNGIRTGGGKEAPIECQGYRKYVLLDVPKKEYVEGVLIGGRFVSAGTVKTEGGSRIKAFRYVGIGQKTDQFWKCIDWDD
jgi:hypothetical protein